MAKNVVFGIDRMRLVPVSAAGVSGTALTVLGRALSFNNETDDEQFEANNEVIDRRYFNKSVTGSAEIAQHTPAALALLDGGTVITTGTAPNQSFTYTATRTINLGMVTVETRSWSGQGTIVQCSVYETMTAGPSFDLATGAYAGVTFDFTGTGAITTPSAGALWGVTSYEGTTAASIEFGA